MLCRPFFGCLPVILCALLGLRVPDAARAGEYPLTQLAQRPGQYAYGPTAGVAGNGQVYWADSNSVDSSGGGTRIVSSPGGLVATETRTLAEAGDFPVGLPLDAQNGKVLVSGHYNLPDVQGSYNQLNALYEFPGATRLVYPYSSFPDGIVSSPNLQIRKGLYDSDGSVVFSFQQVQSPNIVFTALGRVSGGTVTVLARSGVTKMPGTDTAFTKIGGFSTQGGVTFFYGEGGGKRGVYQISGGAITKVIEDGDPDPTGGTGASFASGSLANEGADLAVVGGDGVYKRIGGTWSLVVKSGAPLPGRSGTFSILSSPALHNGKVMFFGGVQASTFLSIPPQAGLYVESDQGILPVVDLNSNFDGLAVQNLTTVVFDDGGGRYWNGVNAVFQVTYQQPDGHALYLATPPVPVAGVPEINSALSLVGNLREPFSYQIVATNGATSFDAYPLPAGLSIDHATGLISGQPTVVGALSPALQATNAIGSSRRYATLTIYAGAISSPKTASAVAGQPFAYQITVDGFDPGPYANYRVSNLPPGLDYSASTGLISGTILASAPAITYGVSLYASDGRNKAAAGTLALTVTSGITPPPPPPPVSPGTITSAATAGGTVDRVFLYQITADFTPTAYDAAGLPDGLTLNPATGTIAGTPSAAAAGTHPVQVSARDASGHNASLTLTITIAPKPSGVGSADLVLTVADAPDPVAVGSLVTYTFTLLNKGPDVATDIKGGFVKDSNMTFIVDGSQSGVTVAGNTLSFFLPALASGATQTYSLVFRAEAAGIYRAAAGVGASQDDPHTADNGLLETTEARAVGGGVDNAPVITGEPGAQILLGDPFTYQIATDGAAPVDSYGASGLPAGLSVDAATGLISGTVPEGAAAAGTIQVTLTATNGSSVGTATRLFSVVEPPTDKAGDVTGSLKKLAVKLAGAGSQYKVTGEYSLKNLGDKAVKNPRAGVYLAKSANFSFPAPSDAQAAGLLPLAVKVMPTSENGAPVYRVKVSLPADGQSASLVEFPLKLTKKGKPGSKYKLDLVLKASAADLPAQVLSGQYRYLIVALDPENTLLEASKSNNLTVIDLQALLSEQ